MEIEQDESTLQWIHNYFNILLSHWHTQYRWFNQVFSSEPALDVLIDIYIDVLETLDPTLNECIDAALKQLPDKLAYISEVKQSTKQFEESLIKIIDQSTQGKFFKSYYNICRF